MAGKLKQHSPLRHRSLALALAYLSTVAVLWYCNQSMTKSIDDQHTGVAYWRCWFGLLALTSTMGALYHTFGASSTSSSRTERAFYVARIVTRSVGSTALNFAVFDTLGIDIIFNAFSLRWFEFRVLYLLAATLMCTADYHFHVHELREDFGKASESVTLVNLVLAIVHMVSHGMALPMIAWYHLLAAFVLLLVRFSMHAEGEYCDVDSQEQLQAMHPSLQRVTVPGAPVSLAHQVVRIMLLNVLLLELACLHQVLHNHTLD